MGAPAKAGPPVADCQRVVPTMVFLESVCTRKGPPYLADFVDKLTFFPHLVSTSADFQRQDAQDALVL